MPLENSSTRKQQFDYLKEHIPEEGDTLVALEADARVFESNKDNKTTKYVNACIDQKATGWYLSNEERGLKCLIAKKHHDKVGATVTKLRVVRQAENKMYVICELME